MMEENKEHQNSSSVSGNEGNNTASNDNLSGAAGKTDASGKSMIEENSAENTQGSGITAGSVVGGVGSATGNDNTQSGTSGTGKNSGT